MAFARQLSYQEQQGFQKKNEFDLALLINNQMAKHLSKLSTRSRLGGFAQARTDLTAFPYKCYNYTHKYLNLLFYQIPMDYYNTTEEDWRVDNKCDLLQDHEDFQDSLCSSPVWFGHLANKPNRTQSGFDKPYLDYDLPIITPQSEVLPLEQQDDLAELENLLQKFPVAIQKKGIKKPRKPRTKSYQVCSGLVKDFVKKNFESGDVINQIQKCQEAKKFIDRLEGILITLKSQMLSQIQSRFLTFSDQL